MAEEKAGVMIEDDDNIVDDKEVEYVAVENEPDKKVEDEEDERPESRTEQGEDREEIRARRREEKKERKERRETAIKRDKLELDFLRKRNDDLEQRLDRIEKGAQQTAEQSIDAQIQAAVREVEAAEKVIAKAVEAGNGEDVAKAMRYRDQAIAKANNLAAHKQQYSQQQITQQPKIDHEVVHYAQEFINDNQWYDPQGKDKDSLVVQEIDARLMQEGYDPRTQDYWDELQDRVESRFPDKFKSRKPVRGPAVAGNREHAPASTRKEIYISPERKAALIEAGVWDDPVLRQKYIKRYAEYDRQNQNG